MNKNGSIVEWERKRNGKNDKSYKFLSEKRK